MGRSRSSWLAPVSPMCPWPHTLTQDGRLRQRQQDVVKEYFDKNGNKRVDEVVNRSFQHDDSYGTRRRYQDMNKVISAVKKPDFHPTLIAADPRCLRVCA